MTFHIKSMANAKTMLIHNFQHFILKTHRQSVAQLTLSEQFLKVHQQPSIALAKKILSYYGQ